MATSKERVNGAFSELFSSMLIESGFTQSAFARSVGLEQTTVNRLVRGTGPKPRYNTIFKVVNGLGLKFTDEKALKLYETAGLKLKPVRQFEAIDALRDLQSEENSVSARLGRIEARLDKLTSIFEAVFRVPEDH